MHALRILDRLLDVLDGDEPLQPEVAIDDEELLDLLLMQDLARFVERRPDRHGDEILLASSRRSTGRSMLVSKRRSRLVRMPTSRPSLLPSSVIGTPEMRYLRISSSASLMRRVGRERDRVDDHAALGPLDSIHLERLLLDRQVLVDDAEAAVLRHGDRHLGLGDRVHGGAQERHVQRGCCASAGCVTSTCAGSTVECRGTSRMSSNVSAVRRPAAREQGWRIVDFV